MAKDTAPAGTIISPWATAPAYRAPTGARKAVFAMLTLLIIALTTVLVAIGYCVFKAHCYYEEVTKKVGWEGVSCVRDDPELGYVPTENSWTRHRLPPIFTVWTDNRGGRVAEPNQTAPSKINVLTVGCSFTWGHGVDDADTYARCLQRRTGLEVYNVGVASYGTTTALLSMERYADLRPKVIVYGYIDNHKLRSINPSALSICPFVRPVPFVDFDDQDRPFIHPPIGSTELHDRYLREVILDHPFGAGDVYWAMYREYQALTLPANVHYSANDPAIMPKLINAGAWSNDPERLQRVLNYLLGEMAAQAKAMDAKLVVAHLPMLEQWSTLPANLRDAVAAVHAPDTPFVVDTYPIMKELADAQGINAVFNPYDHHPTAAAHARIAEALEPIVRKLADER
jgi:hypothetical protein